MSPRGRGAEELLIAADGPVTVLTLNRPEARNALSGSLWRALAEAVRTLDGDPGVSVMVLTGADPAFSAGFDLKALSSEDRSDQRRRQSEPPDFLGVLPPHDTPVIAAVNGAAVTGGLELVLACDVILASERARFADTHARVGLMPGGGLTVALPALIGPARARQMSLTGDFIDAATASSWGLANEVVAHERLLERATALGRSMAQIPKATLAALRTLYAETDALAGPAAYQLENERSRTWMAARFDQQRLAQERQAIVERGRRQQGDPRR